MNYDISKEEKEIVERKRIKKVAVEEKKGQEYEFGLNHLLEIFAKDSRRNVKKSSTTRKNTII